jgi:hypothetical protein
MSQNFETKILVFTTELLRRQENSGAKFRLFSKLLTKIRRMIWDFALEAPQIHHMSEKLISPSRILDVLYSNPSGDRQHSRIDRMSVMEVFPKQSTICRVNLSTIIAHFCKGFSLLLPEVLN